VKEPGIPIEAHLSSSSYAQTKRGGGWASRRDHSSIGEIPGTVIVASSGKKRRSRGNLTVLR
jgi:hypothetical protein